MTEETQGNVEVATSHRVKLYQLSIETSWEDKGTGQCVYQVVRFYFYFLIIK
jgi:hypothetical protein